MLLALVEQVGEADVDGVDLEDVPEDLGNKVFPANFRNDVERSQGLDPGL